ncbi:MAG TPA: ATP-binding protein [Leptolyngbyaceae cyanobacterium]
MTVEAFQTQSPKPSGRRFFAIKGVPSLQQGRAWTNRLSIRQKIYFGYLLSLGIAVAGTTTGMVVGRQAYELAEHRREDVIEEVAMISQLQLQLSHLQMHQQSLSGNLAFPHGLTNDIALLQEHLPLFSRAWFELKENYLKSSTGETSEETKALQTVVKTYSSTVEQYITWLSKTTTEITADLPALDNAALLRVNLLTPEAQGMGRQLESLTEDLESLQEIALTEQTTATKSLEQAQTRMLLLMLGSIGLSVAIASLLAQAISRAIAQPINEVSAVAQRVTEEGNFALRATVTSQDETAVLAAALNHLVERVKQLIDEQEAATQQTLMQNEKMSSLGRMVAGVAHEINNPVNFIYGNLRHAENYIADLIDLIHTYESAVSQPPMPVEEKLEEIELPFLEEDLPKVMQSMRVGAERTRQIVLSLKNFSRLDEGVASPVDIHDCLDSTLLILNNRTKKGISIVRSYGDIPVIEGYAGSLYQVFMNLFANALDVLEEQPPQKPEIAIATERLGSDWIKIRIADNGPGIPAHQLPHIFEAFFTTKPSGVGTGLGLAISRQIVEEKHGGRITCKSTLNQGTEFTIELPLRIVQEAVEPALQQVT